MCIFFFFFDVEILSLISALCTETVTTSKPFVGWFPRKAFKTATLAEAMAYVWCGIICFCDQYIYIINQLNKPQQPAAHTQQSEDEQKTIHQQNTQNYILNFIDLRQKIA